MRKIGLNRQKTEYEPSKLCIKYHTYHIIMLYYRYYTLIWKEAVTVENNFFLLLFKKESYPRRKTSRPELTSDYILFICPTSAVRLHAACCLCLACAPAKTSAAILFVGQIIPIMQNYLTYRQIDACVNKDIINILKTCLINIIIHTQFFLFLDDYFWVQNGEAFVWYAIFFY